LLRTLIVRIYENSEIVSVIPSIQGDPRFSAGRGPGSSSDEERDVHDRVKVYWFVGVNRN
jgi:hypothetical protein